MAGGFVEGGDTVARGAVSPGSAGKVRVRYIWLLATPPTSTLHAVDMPGILQWER